MALQGIAPLSTFDEEGGSADCGGVFVGDQHAPGKARALWIVQGRCGQGRGEPGVAEGEGGPGGVVYSRFGG